MDGRASKYGDPGRGARFNSAIRYVESSNAPCFAVVVSEDRGVDLIPDLRPAIKRSDIDTAIREMELIKVAERVTRRKYIDVLDWLDEHRFYLLQTHCDTLNELLREIEDRLDSQEESNMKIIRQPFAPHPGMDESFYYLSE